jgi:hypothetical protein
MVTIDARSRAFRILASIGVFHQAMRETESIYPIPRPTSFRIWQTLLTTDRFIDHGFRAFSKLRRSGWRQMALEPKFAAYSQPSGASIKQYEISRDCPRYLVRHRSRSGTGLWILTVLSVMASHPSRSYGDQDGDKACQNQYGMHTGNLRGFAPRNPRNRELALDTWSDIFSDLADALDC